jgi:hypothetical protein
MLKMTEQELLAYNASKTQPSSRSRAAVLARYIERCKADEASLTDPLDRLTDATIPLSGKSQQRDS